jgi:hypothetical protein
MAVGAFIYLPITVAREREMMFVKEIGSIEPRLGVVSSINRRQEQPPAVIYNKFRLHDKVRQ